MTKVTGTFNTRMEADRAFTELLNRGFAKDDISIIMSDQTREKFFAGEKDMASSVAKGGASGAVIGGGLGALVAGLTAIGSITIPGSGLLMAGPIVAALSGAGAGAAVGGLTGALINAGIDASEADAFEDDIKAGKIVVVVDADSASEVSAARSALQNFGATTKAA